MYKQFINNYLKKLNKNDILVFAHKNNIILNNKELDYVYEVIKNQSDVLLSDNYNEIFNQAKNMLSKINYEKIYDLFITYKNKYFN